MRSDRERFLDIQEAIDKIERYVPRGRQSFENDEMFQVWVVRHLQIIGEAASRVSVDTQKRFPEIPWGKMIGMRQVLVHGYFDIDLEVVWVSRLNRIHDSPFNCLGLTQIPTQVEVHPKISRYPDKLAQPESRSRGNTSALVNDPIDSLMGNLDGVGLFALGDA